MCSTAGHSAYAAFACTRGAQSSANRQNSSPLASISLSSSSKTRLLNIGLNGLPWVVPYVPRFFLTSRHPSISFQSVQSSSKRCSLSIGSKLKLKKVLIELSLQARALLSIWIAVVSSSQYCAIVYTAATKVVVLSIDQAWRIICGRGPYNSNSPIHV